MNNFSEIWSFLKTRKKFWLLPTLIMLLLIGLLIMIAGGSAIAPFIYTLF
jgi:competence protein ComGC